MVINNYYYYYFDACKDAFVSVERYIFKSEMTY